MIREALARVLHALADRLEVEKPQPEIQYVYIYNTPPATTWGPGWQPPPVYPTITRSLSNASGAVRRS